MSKRTLAGIASVVTCFSLWQFSPALQAAPPAADLVADFQSYFQQHVADEEIVGAAYVIASHEGIVALGTAGYTDVRRSSPIDKDTVFRVASVSKTFAAGLAGILVDEGRFRWDDRVVDHVPGFRINGDSSQIRVRDLLGQSTGLMPHAYDNLIEDGVSLERIQKKYTELSYICPPGTCYTYQNSIFSLIEPVIENATAQSYADLMESRIFRPLGMDTASVGFEPFVSDPNHAQPHIKSRGKWKTIRVSPNYYRVAPAAGVNASALDMGKWLSAQLGGRPAIISSAVVETLVEPRVETRRDTYRKFWREIVSEAHYGLGWRIYRMGDHRIAYHSGWVSGYRADIAWSQEHDIGIAVLMNTEGNSISELTTTFWRLAFERTPPVAGGKQRQVLAGSSPSTESATTGVR